MNLQDAAQFFNENDFPAAEKSCRTILEETPNHPPALNLMAGICARTGRLQDAIGWMERACDNDPGNHEFWANLGRLYQFGGQPEQAINVFIKAVNLAPEQAEYKEILITLLETMQFPEFNQNAKDALLACLRDETLGLQNIALAWHSLIDTDPTMAAVTTLKKHKTYDEFQDNIATNDLIETLNTEFFIRGLSHCTVISPPFERLLTHLRRYFLEQASTDQDLQPFTPFLCALASHCFLGEYVFFTSDEEYTALKNLDIDSYPAIAACYQALYLYDTPEQRLTTLQKSKNDSLIRLAKEQIEEPLQEKQLKESLPSLTDIADETSKNVRAQYEENPYPRWKTISIGEYKRHDSQRGEGKTILNAGCGTGQEPISNALYYSAAQMTAIDLSRASMAYAARKAQQFDVNNITFMHADILSAAQLDQKFDFITSSGVIHHMKDPVAGLRSLINVLAKDGVMKIGLYSTIARRHITTCREWIVQQGYDATADSIRAFRQDLFETADQNGFIDIVGMKDFYSLSQCRDLLFHVQEHTFTCPEMHDMIEAENLRLLYFDAPPQAKQDYARLFPQDTTQTNLDNWHSYETQNKDTFLSMYSLWLGRQEDFPQSTLPDWIVQK